MNAKRKLKQVIFEGRTYYWRPTGYYQTADARYLHRDIWESLHGPLPDDFIVHHADCDRDNNNPENLQAMPNEVHLALHREEREPTLRVCITCGKEFLSKRGYADFCSKPCHRKVYGKEYRATHQDSIRDSRRRYDATHKAEKRAYLLAHKTEINAKRRARRAAASKEGKQHDKPKKKA